MKIFKNMLKYSITKTKKNVEKHKNWKKYETNKIMSRGVARLGKPQLHWLHRLQTPYNAYPDPLPLLLASQSFAMSPWSCLFNLDVKFFFAVDSIPVATALPHHCSVKSLLEEI